MWIFGYGSLVWRPSIPFSLRVPVEVSGFSRRFWQGSPDHRGTPDSPGRVVTLIPDETGTPCRGMAYRIPDGERASTLAYLDEREQGGYARLDVPVAVVDGVLAGEAKDEPLPISATVYLAGPENPHWLGPAPIVEIARQVVQSHGPSGPNVDYVLELDGALFDLGALDPHVREVADAVRALLTPHPEA